MPGKAQSALLAGVLFGLALALTLGIVGSSTVPTRRTSDTPRAAVIVPPVSDCGDVPREIAESVFKVHDHATGQAIPMVNGEHCRGVEAQRIGTDSQLQKAGLGSHAVVENGAVILRYYNEHYDGSNATGDAADVVPLDEARARVRAVR